MLRQTCATKIPILISPVLRITFKAVTVDVPPNAILIFTSENGVRAFTQSVPALGRRAFCVGDRTAATAEQLGFKATSANGDATDLVRLMQSQNRSECYIFACGAEVRVDVAVELKTLGFKAEKVVVYAQEPQPFTQDALDLIASETRVILPLFSPRSATLVCDAVQGAPATFFPVALSQAVAEAWTGKTVPHIARAPDAISMITQIATILSDPSP